MKKFLITVLLAACAASEPDAVRDEPATSSDFYSLMPQQTRAGTARFTTDVIHDPRVAAVFIDRLRRQVDDERTRGALVEALPRTGAEVGDAMAELVAVEPSPHVRSIYVHGARRLPPAAAHRILRRAFADGALDVRREAARTAAFVRVADALETELIAAAADADPELRREATRSLDVLAKVRAASARP